MVDVESEHDVLRDHETMVSEGYDVLSMSNEPGDQVRRSVDRGWRRCWKRG